MKTYSMVCAAALLSQLAGCYATTLRSGLTPEPKPRVELDERWHHGVIWGIAELSGPYDLKKLCPNGWAEVTTETSFLNGLLSSITSSLYTPQTVTVRCTGAEAEGEPQESGEAGPDEAAADGGKQTL